MASEPNLKGDPELTLGASVWRWGGVRLRAVEADDWPLFVGWNEDDDIARRLHQIPFPQDPEAVRRWTAEAAANGPTDDRMRWIVEDAAGEPVGGIATHGCDRRHGTFAYGLHVDAAHRKHGHATAAITIVLRYFFGELRYQKANVQVFAFNEASIVLHERLGFQLEGRLRRSVFTDGAFHDVLLYGLTDDEFNALHREAGG
jgi:RimJ/RimL family protein N-acetyltransferase